VWNCFKSVILATILYACGEHTLRIKTRRRSGGTYRLNLHGSTMNMKAVGTFVIAVCFYCDIYTGISNPT
jgi:hypothetical protein